MRWWSSSCVLPQGKGFQGPGKVSIQSPASLHTASRAKTGVLGPQIFLPSDSKLNSGAWGGLFLASTLSKVDDDATTVTPLGLRSGQGVAVRGIFFFNEFWIWGLRCLLACVGSPLWWELECRVGRKKEAVGQGTGSPHMACSSPEFQGVQEFQVRTEPLR